MSNNLEQFIRDHRDEFDSEEPSKKVWEAVQQPAEPVKQEPAKVVSIRFMRWMSVAAVLILVSVGTWYFTRQANNSQGGIVPGPVANTEKPAEKPAVDTTTVKQQLATTPAIDSSKTNLAHKASPQKAEPSVTEDMKEEMAHYASLVEIKHRELKKIEKDEPLLYKQFAGDVNKLDSVYNSLKKQLPSNPNREQLLEAMIQNLQLQMGLLNHQLDIIKQINHSKKSAYEKAYKSI
jgi:hypothetical protein